MREKLTQQAKQETATELKDLQEQLKEKNQLAEEAQKRELEIRKQSRQLQEKQKKILTSNYRENWMKVEKKLKKK